MGNKNNDKKLNKKEKAAIEREELKAKLLENYVEGDTNIDWEQLSADEYWKVAIPSSSSSIAEKEKSLGRKLPLIPKEEWVERELTKIESQKPKISSYKVQDPIAKQLKYKQKFVEAIKEIHPQIISELMDLVPDFKVLFANENKKQYYAILDELKCKLLLHWRIYPSYYGVSFQQFDQSYLWEAVEMAFYLASIRNYHFELGTLSGDSNATNRLIEENKYLLETFSNEVKTAFKDTCENQDLILSSFFHLQREIYKWVKKYNLRKDWLIEYAYYFIYQFSEDPLLETKDIAVGVKDYDYANTYYYPFEFEAYGWWASGDGETANQYKARVTREFEEKLEQYIVEASTTLKLSELPKFTNPPTFKSVKYLVYWTIKGWDAERILEKCFPEIAAVRTDNDVSALTFENKIKYIKSEINKLKEYDLPMP